MLEKDPQVKKRLAGFHFLSTVLVSSQNYKFLRFIYYFYVHVCVAEYVLCHMTRALIHARQGSLSSKNWSFRELSAT